MKIFIQQELLDALKNGDSKTFKIIFDLFYPALVNYAKRYVKNCQVAEDIAVDTLLKYWKKNKDFESGDAIKGFLYVTTRNSCLNHLEQVHRRKEIRDRIFRETERIQDSALNEIIKNEVLRELFFLIERLSPQCRRIIVMAFTEGLNDREIATKLRLSLHTIRNHRRRGIIEIKKRINLRNNFGW